MTHLHLLAGGALAAILVLAAGCRLWPALRPPPVPIEVVLGDRAQRRRWRRQLGDGVRRLHRLAGPSTGGDVALLVVDWLPDGQRAATSPTRRRTDGRTVHLVSLALGIPERRLAPDEVLAALAEQYLALTLAPKPRATRAPAPPAAPPPQPIGALLRDLGPVRNGRPE